MNVGSNIKEHAMDRETVHGVVLPLRPDVFSKSLVCHAESEIKMVRS